MHIGVDMFSRKRFVKTDALKCIAIDYIVKLYDERQKQQQQPPTTSKI